VFLSANTRNIDVFRSIAEHETFRKQITEIVWDDARLVASQDEQDDSYDPENAEDLYYEFSEGDCPRWFL
jgi:transcriptional accessory protein Tex/SPT6